MIYNYLQKPAIEHFIDEAIREDIGDGDHSSLSSIPADAKNTARLIIKDNGTIAGLDLAYMIFERIDPKLKIDKFLKDGDKVKTGDIAFEVSGKSRSILSAERLVLNCMQRMSAIATKTRKLADLIAHTNTKLLDTRKTTPNFRIPEKWAVKIGGGSNHRFALFDMIMIKDNHVDFAGGIEAAIMAANKYISETKKDLEIEIETRNIEEVKEVVSVGKVNRIMLDNMSVNQMKEALALIANKFQTEASGGITEETIVPIAETGVDYISVGAITHSYKSLDMSLKAI
ncbi:carboxylating nicotinate-nucleotide diphosphorylase [Hyphobacterium sp. CCMP332]|nr:carboxylating nicotinate-nucleotide diphosphorylase [Hyphobacterium sp. CCMP332]